MVKNVGKLVIFFGFFASLRRVAITSYIPLILLTVFYAYTPQEISLYLMIIQVPLIIFYYVAHKIRETVFITLSIAELILFLSLSIFYRESIFLFLSLIFLANMSSSLRAPVVEETVVKLLNFSTKNFFILSLDGYYLLSVSLNLICIYRKTGFVLWNFYNSRVIFNLAILFVYKVIVERK